MFLRAGWLVALTCSLAAGALRVEQILQVPLHQLQSVNSLVSDRGGNLIVTGSNFQGGFIYKLDPLGSVIFSFVNFGAYPTAAAADANGDLIWVGSGGSPGFPFPFTKTILPADSGSYAPGFVVKFRGSDGAIAWAAKLEALQPQAVAVDAVGRIMIAGVTTTASPPATAGAYRSLTSAEVPPLGVARLTADGDVEFLAAYGGHSINGTSSCVSNPWFQCLSDPLTSAAAVLLDAQGHIWVAGSTNEIDVPITPNALRKTCGCGVNFSDGFLAEFSADGSSLLYATYLGTSGIHPVYSAAMEPAGRIWLAGSIATPSLAITSDAVQSTFSGDQDGFLLAYDPAGNRVAYATYYGTHGSNTVTRVAVAPDGRTIFSGHLDSNRNNPYSFGKDFLAVRSASGLESLSLLLGGANAGLAFTPSGALLVAGSGSAIARLNDSAATAPSISGVANSAALTATAHVSPGEIVSIMGTNLASGAVKVWFDGVAAPLLYVSATRINAVVPFEVADQTETRLTVENDGGKSVEARLGVVAAMPAVFTTGEVKQDLPVAAALNEDGTLNGASNPAAAGSVVAVFGTGFGALTPAPPNGAVVTAPLPSLTGQVSIFGGPGFITVLYAGPAPGLVAGAMQVNFRVPDNLAGNPTLTLFAAGWPAAYFTIWAK